MSSLPPHKTDKMDLHEIVSLAYVWMCVFVDGISKVMCSYNINDSIEQYQRVRHYIIPVFDKIVMTRDSESYDNHERALRYLFIIGALQILASFMLLCSDRARFLASISLFGLFYSNCIDIGHKLLNLFVLTLMIYTNFIKLRHGESVSRAKYDKTLSSEETSDFKELQKNDSRGNYSANKNATSISITFSSNLISNPPSPTITSKIIPANNFTNNNLFNNITPVLKRQSAPASVSVNATMRATASKSAFNDIPQSLSPNPFSVPSSSLNVQTGVSSVKTPLSASAHFNNIVSSSSKKPQAALRFSISSPKQFDKDKENVAGLENGRRSTFAPNSNHKFGEGLLPGSNKNSTASSNRKSFSGLSSFAQ